VARVELGALTYGFSAIFNGAPAVPIGVYLQPGANALEVAQSVKDAMQRISKRFPEGLRYDIPFNTTRFVEVSIEEVVITFIEAIALVVLVVFLFLQSVRAMIIPVIAIPVSIIGTFAGMYMLGFSINMLTLFGWCWPSASWSTMPSSCWRTSNASWRPRDCRRVPPP
jgi:multidrug efflux pump subunit AcrB